MGEEFNKDFVFYCNGRPLNKIGELNLSDTNVNDDVTESFELKLSVKMSRFKMWKMRHKLKKTMRKARKNKGYIEYTLKFD